VKTITCRDCGGADQTKFRPSYRDICVDCWKARIRRNNPDWRERQKARDSQPNCRFSRGRAQSRSRGLPWLITLEFFKELIAKPCEYCEGPLDPTGIAMDRIEHELGYTPENVVPACCICNDMRARVFTYEEMKRIGAVIKEIRAERAAAGIPQPKTSAYFYRLRKMEVREKARASVEA
jgi:hypothetical protein